MAKNKRLAAAYESFDKRKSYPLPDAVRLVKQNARAKFDETVELAMNLGIDPRQATRNLLAARSVRDLVDASGGLYQPPGRFRNW